MSEYKELNYNRELLDSDVAKCLNEINCTLDGDIQTTARGKRVIFGRSGDKFASVDIYFKSNGSTTIQWKTGKNQQLGEQLAILLKATIDPSELESVNYSLNGFVSETVETIISCLEESNDIEVQKEQLAHQGFRYVIRSKEYDDHLTVTHHETTRLLQIQGRPLSCYNRFVFLLIDLLDLKGLELVLSRKEDGSAEIVRQEVAVDYLKSRLSCFDELPEVVQKLLVSGCCVKLASPNLPDYSMLLYPDLRAFEGVLKRHLTEHGLSVDEAEHGFGSFFNSNDGTCSLKQEHVATINHTKLVEALNAGYTFYKKHRHSLFHMEELTAASRMVDTLNKALSLAKDTYMLINNIYGARN